MVFRRRDPFGLFDALFRDLFEDWFEERLEERMPASGKSLGYVEPAVDIVESDREYHVVIDLPGVKKEDIQLIPQEGGIELKAERKEEFKKQDEKQGYFHVERRYTGFYRFISLPEDADVDKAEAEYRNGVLEIRIPKKRVKEAKKKGIRIR